MKRTLLLIFLVLALFVTAAAWLGAQLAGGQVRAPATSPTPCLVEADGRPYPCPPRAIIYPSPTLRALLVLPKSTPSPARMPAPTKSKLQFILPEVSP